VASHALAGVDHHHPAALFDGLGHRLDELALHAQQEVLLRLGGNVAENREVADGAFAGRIADDVARLGADEEGSADRRTGAEDAAGTNDFAPRQAADLWFRLMLNIDRAGGHHRVPFLRGRSNSKRCARNRAGRMCQST